MAYIQPDGGAVSLALSGALQTISDGAHVALPLIGDDDVIIVGPDGQTAKIGIASMPDRRVLVELDSGQWIEVRAVSTLPALLADAAGRIPQLNGIGQLADWMIPSSLPRRFMAHMLADGILDTFTFQHDLGVPVQHIAIADVLTYAHFTDAVEPTADPLDINNKTILFFPDGPPTAGVYLVSFVG